MAPLCELQPLGKEHFSGDRRHPAEQLVETNGTLHQSTTLKHYISAVFNQIAPSALPTGGLHESDDARSHLDTGCHLVKECHGGMHRQIHLLRFTPMARFLSQRYESNPSCRRVSCTRETWDESMLCREIPDELTSQQASVIRSFRASSTFLRMEPWTKRASNMMSAESWSNGAKSHSRFCLLSGAHVCYVIEEVKEVLVRVGSWCGLNSKNRSTRTDQQRSEV